MYVSCESQYIDIRDGNVFSSMEQLREDMGSGGGVNSDNDEEYLNGCCVTEYCMHMVCIA